MMIYLCSSAAALTACLVAQPTTQSVGLLTTATQLPAEMAVHWAAVVTVTDAPEATAVEALQPCPCVVVVADQPVSSGSTQQNLCAAIAALAARGTTLIFAENAAPLAGHRPDKRAAALLPDTIVVAGLAQTPDPSTLASLGDPRRLLVLDGATYVAVNLPDRTITVHGSGSALVVTWPAAGQFDTARFTADVLTAGMSQVWVRAGSRGMNE